MEIDLLFVFQWLSNVKNQVQIQLIRPRKGTVVHKSNPLEDSRFKPCMKYARASKIGQVHDSVYSIDILQAQTKLWKWAGGQYFYEEKIRELLAMSISFAQS